MSYKPKEPFTTQLGLYNPTYSSKKGVTVKSDYEFVDVINASFKTYGGTESIVNDVLAVIDTANIETWYRPDIQSNSRIKLNDKFYELIGEPENIELRNQYLKFKVRGVKGGA